MPKDIYYTQAEPFSVSKKQKNQLESAANGVWYYEAYFKMAILEDKLAGKLMSKKGVKK